VPLVVVDLAADVEPHDIAGLHRAVEMPRVVEGSERRRKRRIGTGHGPRPEGHIAAVSHARLDDGRFHFALAPAGRDSMEAGDPCDRARRRHLAQRPDLAGILYRPNLADDRTATLHGGVRPLLLDGASPHEPRIA